VRVICQTSMIYTVAANVSEQQLSQALSRALKRGQKSICMQKHRQRRDSRWRERAHAHSLTVVQTNGTGKRPHKTRAADNAENECAGNRSASQSVDCARVCLCMFERVCLICVMRERPH
jgi:hypothetical protein